MLPSVEERNFIPLEGGIWYFTPNTNEGSRLEYYDFSTQSSRTVFRTSRPVFVGMTLSPDRRRLLFTQTDRSPEPGSDARRQFPMSRATAESSACSGPFRQRGEAGFRGKL